MARRLLPGNLPAEVSSFVGRRREFSEIRRLLATARLLTLTGVGGVGKTRLALRVAALARRSFPDGVWLAELGGLQDPVLVPEVVAKALGISDQLTGDPTRVVAGFLQGRQLLLVVDGGELLLPAVALLVVELLRAAPGLRVLATSREAVRVAGEFVYPVAPLPVPVANRRLSAAGSLRYPAVALFVERASAVNAEFVVDDDNAALVAGLCQRLDGLPLAIELAAVRVRSLSLAQIAHREPGRVGPASDPARRGGLELRVVLQVGAGVVDAGGGVRRRVRSGRRRAGLRRGWPGGRRVGGGAGRVGRQVGAAGHRRRRGPPLPAAGHAEPVRAGAAA
ncbi:MAG: hypothetical protein E6F99_21975 [Actinobacteria bacterium]|nr:MAG: hypothetical protein E6F99_21975 [Actinomycetota bacterium]